MTDEEYTKIIDAWTYLKVALGIFTGSEEDFPGGRERILIKNLREAYIIMDEIVAKGIPSTARGSEAREESDVYFDETVDISENTLKMVVEAMVDGNNESCKQCFNKNAVECMNHSDNGYDHTGRCSCNCHMINKKGRT